MNLYNKFLKFIHMVLAVLFTLLSLVFFSGCAAMKKQSMRTVYQDVYIAKPCDVIEPQKPEKQDNVVIAVIELKNYAERLKAAFRACKGEKTRE